LFLIVLMLNISFVFAEDVAYIYKNKNAIDNNIIEVFEDAKLDVDLIQENDIPDNIKEYKILFVGDERFRNLEDIPVGEMPTILSNYYFGEDWGLTDSDGISKLGSNSELKVKINNKIVQVYTQAKYPGRNIAIPYYYLDEHNVREGMEKIAGTYTGSNYDFGDVISYANAGTNLNNGHLIEDKLCFFGIVESEFWTDAAKEMFKDCVDFVGLTCEKNSDCPSDKLGELYCKNGDVYQDESNFKCKNPGSVNSKCEEKVNENLIEDCLFGCMDGECINECASDSDCGDDYYGERYCENGNVVRDYYNVMCLDNECGSEVSLEIVKVCEGGCNNGECVDIKCYSDEDCGLGIFIGEPYCYQGDSWRKFRGDKCFLPGSSLSYCSYVDEPKLIDVCENYCLNGECKICNPLPGVNKSEKPKNINDYFN